MMQQRGGGMPKSDKLRNLMGAMGGGGTGRPAPAAPAGKLPGFDRTQGGAPAFGPDGGAGEPTALKKDVLTRTDFVIFLVWKPNTKAAEEQIPGAPRAG